MFSSATVILLGRIVGAPAYLESSAANADKLLEETSFVLQDLVSSPPWGTPRAWLSINPWCWVPGGKRMQGVSPSLSSPSKVVTLKRENKLPTHKDPVRPCLRTFLQGILLS